MVLIISEMDPQIYLNIAQILNSNVSPWNSSCKRSIFGIEKCLCEEIRYEKYYKAHALFSFSSVDFSQFDNECFALMTFVVHKQVTRICICFVGVVGDTDTRRLWRL